MSLKPRAMVFLATAFAVSALAGLSTPATARALPARGDERPDLVLGRGTVFGGIGSFAFAAVSGRVRDVGIASFAWAPPLGPSAWRVALDCVNVVATPTGHAAAVAGVVIRSSGFAPAAGSRAGFLIWDNTPGGLPDGVGILGPEVPTDCSEIQPVGVFTNVSSGDIVIR